jgi:diguanylate cyclase (GGDEF)-like protein
MALGGLIKSALRETDVLARYGGEEFVVICVNTALPEANLIAERLRQMIESQPIGITANDGAKIELRLSVSIGIAGLCAGLDCRDRLIQCADRAMYRAKQLGRNRVVAAPVEP